MLTPADTGYSIAAIRAAEAELPAAERLFADPYAARFAAAGAHAADGTARFLALPFFRDGIRLRTRFLDDLVGADTATQLVILGAGFDSRGLRIPAVQARGARVFEVDDARVLATKRALLGDALPAHIAHVAADFDGADFAPALRADLRAAGYREGAGALVLLEGVIGYISDDAMHRLFAVVAELGGPGARLALTYGEGTFYPDTAQERLQRWGFSSVDEEGFDALWRRYLPGEPHENAWTARVGVATV